MQTGIVLRELFDRAASIAAVHGRRTISIEMREMGDGSGRTMAIVGWLDDDDREHYLRIAAPAPRNAPRWAPRTWTEDIILVEWAPR